MNKGNVSYPDKPQKCLQVWFLEVHHHGYTSKTFKSASGSFELDTPRDRSGTFDPQVIKKNQTHLTDELERKIIALYAHGNSYQSIREHLKDFYDIDFSNGTLNTLSPTNFYRIWRAGASVTWTRSTPLSGWTRFTTKSGKTAAMTARLFTPF